MSGPVLVSVADSIATITLNRPTRRNAWTVEMQSEYFSALQDLAVDDDVRVLVLTGTGGSFCPGADTEALSAYSATGTTNPAAALIQQPEWYPVTVPKPLIAAIEGPCAGVGLAQALMCDVRVAAPTSRISTAFARRALPAMHGTTVLLQRVAGPATAHSLLLTGRTFSGAEAKELAVVTEVADDPLTRAHAIARSIVEQCAPSSLARIKEQLWAETLPSLAAAIDEVDEQLDDVLASADFREGIASFREKRPPRFAPLRATPIELTRTTS